MPLMFQFNRSLKDIWDDSHFVSVFLNIFLLTEHWALEDSLDSLSSVLFNAFHMRHMWMHVCGLVLEMLWRVYILILAVTLQIRNETNIQIGVIIVLFSVRLRQNWICSIKLIILVHFLKKHVMLVGLWKNSVYTVSLGDQPPFSCEKLSCPECEECEKKCRHTETNKMNGTKGKQWGPKTVFIFAQPRAKTGGSWQFQGIA